MPTLLAAFGSFLLGVLCMDLAFDIQAIGPAIETELALPSISAYYGRILGDDNPSGNLVVVAMSMAILGAVYQIVRIHDSRWLAAIAVFLGAIAIILTATQVVPAASQIVEGTAPASLEVDLARRVAVIHLFCFAAFFGYVAIQVRLSFLLVGRAAE